MYKIHIIYGKGKEVEDEIFETTIYAMLNDSFIIGKCKETNTPFRKFYLKDVSTIVIKDLDDMKVCLIY